jgi:hypothetical protein
MYLCRSEKSGGKMGEINKMEEWKRGGGAVFTDMSLMCHLWAADHLGSLSGAPWRAGYGSGPQIWSEGKSCITATALRPGGQVSRHGREVARGLAATE